MIKEIESRRSIRRYKDIPVKKELIEEILKAGMLADFAVLDGDLMTRQPWHFIVTTGSAKEQVLKAMEAGLKREEKQPFLPESAPYLDGARATLKIMKEAPVIIFITDPLASPMDQPLAIDERVSEICNAQSMGAAIENMTLAATELGLGSLWICNTFFAQEELNHWLNADGQLYAALAVGYADEAPAPRPRRKAELTVEWRK